jgi:hypothetical protein
MRENEMVEERDCRLSVVYVVLRSCPHIDFRDQKLHKHCTSLGTQLKAGASPKPEQGGGVYCVERNNGDKDGKQDESGRELCGYR